MKSLVKVDRLVDSPFSFSLECASSIFPLLGNSTDGVRVSFRALGLPMPGKLVQRVAIEFRREPDLTEVGRSHDEVRFEWIAPAFWLPQFQGVLRFRIESLKTRLILEGEYSPPFAMFGALFDRAIGHRIAEATARDLLTRLAHLLESRWAAEQARSF